MGSAMYSAMGHDLFVRYVMSDLELASALLRLFLSRSVREQLDFEQIRLDKESFVDQKLDALMTDLVYRLPYKEHPFFIAILFEHKSEGAARAGGANLPFQLVRQEVALMEQCRCNDPAGQMPIVLQLGFYHGKRPYKGPRSVAESIQGPAALIPKRWQNQEMILIDLTRYSDAFLAAGGKLGLFLLVLKHVYQQDLLEVLERLVPEIQALQVDQAGINFMITTIHYLIKVADLKSKEGIENFVVKYCTKEVRGEFMTIAEMLQQEGLEKGIKQGMDQGIEIGMDQGIEIGVDKGRREERIEMIVNMYQSGLELEKIEKISKLPRTEIEALLHLKSAT